MLANYNSTGSLVACVTGFRDSTQNYMQELVIMRLLSAF